MRTVLLDIGPLAHLSGKGALSGTDLLNYELLTSPAGKGIVVNNGVIEKITESKELEDEYGSPQSGNEEATIFSITCQLTSNVQSFTCHWQYSTSHLNSTLRGIPTVSDLSAQVPSTIKSCSSRSAS